MTIDQQIDELLKQVEDFMQELIQNQIPCAELIKKVTGELGNSTYYNYLTDIYVDAFIDPAHHWVSLRKLSKPHAIDGRDTTHLTWVTIEIDNQYWWSVSYAKQLIIVHCLPKLIEKALEQVKQDCVIAPTTIVFDPQAPKVKRKRWSQFWRK